MSGCERKIAEVLRKMEAGAELTTLIRQQLDKLKLSSGVDDAGNEELRPYLEIVAQWAKMQRIDAEFYAQRAKRQLTAVSFVVPVANCVHA